MFSVTGTKEDLVLNSKESASMNSQRSGIRLWVVKISDTFPAIYLVIMKDSFTTF